MKMMTEEQLELLRRQISAYTTICHQLVDLHKSISAQRDGMRLGNIHYSDSMMTSVARQRWTPSPTQLQILEQNFTQGNGTPGKNKIKDITCELAQHGPILETNVYNWFQNRRARSKRKHHSIENKLEPEEKKKLKAENIGPCENSSPRGGNVNVERLELKDQTYYLNAQPIQGNGAIFELDHVALFESVPTMDHLIDNMGVPEDYDLSYLGFSPSYQLCGDNNITK